MTIAVLGLGLMGSAVARRLEESGADLILYNRSDPSAREFEERGVRRAATPTETLQAADIVITMLADAAAVETVTLGPGGVLSEPPSANGPKTLVDMSTIDVEASARVAERAAEVGVDYLRAPVSGNPSVVAAGNLTILLSGSREAFERIRPVLLEIGPNLYYLGAGEEARVMKLALNLMIAGTTELLAEALVMGEAHGLDRRAMLEVIGGSVVGSPFVEYKAGPLAEDDYSTTFSARLMAKDLVLALASGESVGVPLPVAEVAKSLVDECVAQGMGDLDFACLVPRLEYAAGRRDALPFA